MSATTTVRTKIIRRLTELFTLDPEFDDITVDMGSPRNEWGETARYVVISRVTGAVDYPHLQRPHPGATVDDMPNFEIWVQGFDSDQMEAAQIAEDTVNLVLRTVSRNPLLALDEQPARLEGVQVSKFDELDGPWFLRTQQGSIVTFRMILHVHTRVRTE